MREEVKGDDLLVLFTRSSLASRASALLLLLGARGGESPDECKHDGLPSAQKSMKAEKRATSDSDSALQGAVDETLTVPISK